MLNARTFHTKVAAPRNIAEACTRRWDLLPYLMIVMLLITAVSLFHVWSRTMVIDLNLQMGEANRIMKEQGQENSRLKLEVASLKSPGRIEGIAKGELGMALPTDQQVVSVR